LNGGKKVEEDKQPQKRKRPIWPWFVLLILTLGAIYVHYQVSVMIEDLKHLARDITQLLEWLLSVLPD